MLKIVLKMSKQVGKSEYSLRDHTYGKVAVKLLNVVQNGKNQLDLS